MKTYIFKASLEQEADGRWSSWIEMLPGCAAWGYNQEEALSALKDAAEVYIEDILEAGDQLPAGIEVIESPVVTVTV
jgi:predicted RNase H-like HicB family nuclease